jgi:abortive infection bacteriophage resistance protein
LNSDQQIEKLIGDGLEIPDVAHAKRRLKWEGYYNFAVGYNRFFKDGNKRYVRGVTFAHIEALFDFDRRLREIVYEATQQVELNLKAILSEELDVPEELITPLFAIARIAGWSAHRIEEIQNNGKIIRPAYINVKKPREYVNIENR